MSKNPVSKASPQSAAASTRSTTALALGIVLIGANLRASITSVGPVIDQIGVSWSLSPIMLGLLNAIPLLAFAAVSPWAAALGRKLGMERALGLALVVLAAGIGIRSAPIAAALWVGTTLIGTAIAVANVLLPALTKRDFHAKAGDVISMYAAAMATVAALASGTVFQLTAGQVNGWPQALSYWMVPVILALLVWIPQLRSHTVVIALSGAEHDHGAASPWRSMLGWQVALFMGLHSLVFYTLVDWLPAYASSLGIAPSTAAGYLLIYQVVAVAANFSMVPLLKRLHDQRLLGVLCAALLACATWGIGWAPSRMLLWLVLGGLGAGFSMVLSLALISLRTGDHQQAASLSGMSQSVGYAVAAVGPALFGLLKDLTHDWQASLIFLGCAPVLLIAVAIFAGRNRVIGQPDQSTQHKP